MKSIAVILIIAVCGCMPISGVTISRHENGGTIVYEVDEHNYAVASPKLAQMETLTLSVVGGNTYNIIKQNCETYVKTIHDFGHDFNDMVKKARQDARNTVAQPHGARFFSSSVSSSHSSSSSSTYVNGQVSERSESSHGGESTYLKGGKDHVTYTGSKLPSHLQSITVDKKHVVFLDKHGIIIMKPNKCLDEHEIEIMRRAGFKVEEVTADQHPTHHELPSEHLYLDDEVEELRRSVRQMHDDLRFGD